MSRYEIAGRVSLSVSGAEDALRYVARQMDPLRLVAGPGAAPEIVLRPAAGSELAPLTHIQRYAGDDLLTGVDDDRVRLVVDGRSCSVPDPLSEDPAVFAYECGFPPQAAFSPYVRTALQLALLRNDAAAVHAAAVELDGRAVLIAGWSESGKTETALALVERGARFLSDKWTVVGADGRAAAFPINVGIRGWALRYLPRLRAALPLTARIQFVLAGVVRDAAAPLRRRTPRTRAGQAAIESLGRVVGLADRIPLAPSELRAAYRQEEDPERIIPLRAVAVLTTAPGGKPASRHAEPGWAAGRLARSAAYERRPYFALVERALFALPHRSRKDRAALVIEREEPLLASALASAEVIELTAPFPTDPRRVADALAARL